MNQAAVLFLLPFLVQCASKEPGIPTAIYQNAAAAPTLQGVKIPVMQSFDFDKRWGKPEIKVLANGGYRLRYSKPGDRFETLEIYGAPGRIESDAPEAPTVEDVVFGDGNQEPAASGSRKSGGPFPSSTGRSTITSSAPAAARMPRNIPPSASAWKNRRSRPPATG